jgi:tetratricopeptide (TPR) repeat protein
MVLQYFGYQVDQNTIKAFLRTNPDDKNVFASEIEFYLETEFGIQTKILVNGDLERLKRLLANGYYVMAESWLHPYEDIGHVTVIRGYDDEQQVLIADDSFLGAGITYPYSDFDAGQWKPFNREYFPVYLPEQEARVRAIIGTDWDQETMYLRAVAQARIEIEQNTQDVYAHFNLGTSLYALGRYEEAAAAFQAARQIGWPRRMLWYQIEPVQTLNQLGRHQEAIGLAQEALAGNETFAEMHFELARAYFGLGNLDQARISAQAALHFAPDFQPAHLFLNSL